MWIHFFDTLCQLLLLYGPLFLKTTVLQFWSSCKKVTNLQSMHSLVKTKAKLSLYYYWLWLHLRAIICKKNQNMKKNWPDIFCPSGKKGLWFILGFKNVLTWGLGRVVLFVFNIFSWFWVCKWNSKYFVFYMQHKPIIILFIMNEQ